MRLEGFNEREVRKEAKAEYYPASYKLAAKLFEELVALRELFETLLFGAGYFECNRMAAIPQGAFAVLQVRKNFERAYSVKHQKEEEEENTRDNSNKSSGFNAKVLQEGRELTPLKYNSKLMNSIWGLYNRYSVHNFKKIDANDSSLLACWEAFTGSPVSAGREVTEVGTAARIAAGH